MTTMEVQCDIKLKYNPTSNATSGSHCKFSRKYIKNEFLLKNRRRKRRNNECERSRCSESRLRDAMQHEILRIYSCPYLTHRSHTLAMKMKIPNGGSGNGTYYGQETGITSYVDNNSDTEAEVQAIGDGDFSEYLWMENEEEFDKQVLQQLEEEELMEECLEAMLEEERQHQRNMSSTAWSTATGTPDNNAAELCQQLSSLRMQDDLAKQSTLNPDAAEFIPAYKSTVVPPVSTSSETTVTTEPS
ncbi:PAI2B protein, partial [Acromyrmex charruanus]